MGFRLLILTEGIHGYKRGGSYVDDLPCRLKERISGIQVDVCQSVESAREVIAEADAAFGDIVPSLLGQAKNLRWIASPQAGPRAGYYHQALIDSDVVVTNFREIFNDHIGAHIMSFVLAFARGLHMYIPQQIQRAWSPGIEAVHLPEAIALIVGVGGIGGEAARLCSQFGMTVIGVDARRKEAPVGVSELLKPEALSSVLARCDFVIVTVPETPQTQGMFAAEQFRLMKSGAFFINIGRGSTVVLDDLVDALREGTIAGAGLDVFQTEPLPVDHPLWDTPGVLITPHVAAAGPYLDNRRTELFLDNCVRFDGGRPMRNVVDKAHWF